jgi:NAD(P)-dependent dehydrogenase (short-subunit alcohol dehydrogenase family)
MGTVRTLTKNIALHWADRGIRVNSVHPGFIDTPILGQAKGTPIEQAMLDVTPLGRDDASFVTGLELYIDGGYMTR